MQACILKEKVKHFLVERKQIYGDFAVQEFEDEFLKQHVISVALCDSEISGVEKKVTFLFYSTKK